MRPSKIAARSVLMAACAVLLSATWMAADTLAAGRTAIVEDISTSRAGIVALDILTDGQKIDLPAGARLVVDYVESCLRETITGGHVTIGLRESKVTGGTVQRETMQCPQPVKTETAAGPQPPLSFRGAVKPKPALTILYTSPVIMLMTPGDAVIERIDHPETSRSFRVETLVDLAKQQIFLTPGGVYKLSANAMELIFRVSPDAMQGGGPLLARLLRL